MNETQLTVVGNVVDVPRLRRTSNGHWVLNFRIASSTRRFDREKGAWTDASTLFVNVTAWRALAENAASSVHKGQPVLVTGRYYQREYKVEEQLRTSYELEAAAIGHDLTRGTSRFERTARSASPQIEVDADGRPADPSDRWYAAHEADPSATPTPAEDVVPAEVDLQSGEIRELAPAG